MLSFKNIEMYAVLLKFVWHMSRLRLSAHRLCTETGRWTKSNSIPVNERKCLTCNVLEDDNHFALKYNALL